MNIAFHTNCLTIRGTEVALYDYALYNELILSNKSFILSNKNSDLTTYDKFKNKFEVFLYDNFEDCSKYLDKNKIEHVYYIKSGEFDGKILPNVKNLNHVVFQNNQPHGEKYVYVGKWLAEKMCGDSENYVPHIINLPEPNDFTLRRQLNIPNNAIVFGRYGGLEEFNYDFVQQAALDAVKKRKDIYFVFMNTNKFADHSNIIHIKGTYDLQYKSNYINMCDAMIHARSRGETFGLAIGEFLFMDKPVISCPFGIDQNHKYMLNNKGLWYTSYSECLDIFLNFKKNQQQTGFYKDLVKEYTPENVMKRFKEKFL